MPYTSRHTNRIKFVPRVSDLLKLEGDYGDFVLSCRHRDILRCSISKHFKSCYSPGRINEIIPYLLCNSRSYAIIGKKDKAGDFLWRAFVRFSEDERGKVLKIYRFYGNGFNGLIGLNQAQPNDSEYYSRLDNQMNIISASLSTKVDMINFVDYDCDTYEQG